MANLPKKRRSVAVSDCPCERDKLRLQLLVKVATITILVFQILNLILKLFSLQIDVYLPNLFQYHLHWYWLIVSTVL